MNGQVAGVLLEIDADAIIDWLDAVGDTLVSDAAGLTPHLIYSVLIIALGFVGAMVVDRVVQRISRSLELDGLVRDSLLGDMFLDETKTVGQLLGSLASLYIYLVVAFLVATELALGRVAAALNGVIGFLPTAVVALVVVAAGFWLADLVEERVSASAPDDGQRIGSLFGMALQVFVYLIAIAVGFGVFAGTSGGAGFAIPIVQAFALGFALAFGLAIGWGAKEYLGEGEGQSESESEGESEAA